MTTLNESLADIEALAHRFSWELMDEAQRDEFMEKIVVPHWGDTTSDGVVLKGAAWARIIGTTGGNIRARYGRLKRRSEQESERTRTDGLTESEKGTIRHARSAMRRHPEQLMGELLADPAIRETLIDQIAADPSIATKIDSKRDAAAPPKQPRQEKPRDYDQMADQGINLITVALAAESSGKWTPSDQVAGQMYFLAQQLDNRQMPPNWEGVIREIEDHANRPLR